jgi:hypothetical protein
VVGRQRHDVSTLISEKRVNADDDCAGAQLDKGAEGVLISPFSIQDMQLQAERARASRTPLVSGSVRELSGSSRKFDWHSGE